ncbi:MAG: isoprenylcysteine carboxylmethyltransferase family protein [Verrucomicrobiae bacterium]|nr:isoprenylcysteine carboxylmethyltransferase family protein [Verrucomicrobiae bacterium]
MAQSTQAVTVPTMTESGQHFQSSRRFGSVLVAVQFVALTILVWHVLPAIQYWPSALMILGSLALMGWALATMGKLTFRFHPDPSEQGTLRTGGAYQWMRHPMYTAALLATSAVVWRNPNHVVVVSACLVAIVLLLKIRIEEAALRRKFYGYNVYAERVPALVPFLPRWMRRGLARIGLPD